MIEWSEVKECRNVVQGKKGVKLGFAGGRDICSVMVCDKNGKNNLTLTFMHDVYENIYSFEAAKAKAEELLTEWLTTAIKDLPEDKLAELGLVRMPAKKPCNPVNNYWGADGRCFYCGAGDDSHHSFTCPTDMHQDKASIKRGG